MARESLGTEASQNEGEQTESHVVEGKAVKRRGKERGCAQTKAGCEFVLALAGAYCFVLAKQATL